MKTKRNTFFYCLISAFIFITLCSKSSFIYPMNDWGDANCYFTLGKGMLSGLVPYRDYFEQKGIFIFALYSLGVLISKTSFFGIYLIELLLLTAFLAIVLKTIALFTDVTKYSFIITAILAGAVCSSTAFSHGGSAEEMLLTLFAYGIYLGLKYFVKDECPSKKEMLLFGIFAAVIFYTKFTLSIVYIAIIVFMIIKAVRSKQAGLLFKNALAFAGGCILISGIVFAYFIANNALSDFIDVYFYRNLFYYNRKESVVGIFDLLKTYFYYSFSFFRFGNILIVFFVLAGEVWLIRTKKYFLALFQFVTFAAYYFMAYVVMVPIRYYALPFSALMVFGMVALVDILSRLNFKVTALINVGAVIAMIVISVVLTDNRYYMFKSKDTVPQYIFAEEMASYGYDDYHMLYYGNLDQGYYFATGTMPNCKAFSWLNLTGDELRNMQNDHINSKKCEFIVSTCLLCDSSQYDEYLKEYPNEKEIVSFDDFGYEQIDEVQNFFEKKYYTVRLYKIK